MYSDNIIYEQIKEDLRLERYVFASAVDGTLGSARDTRGVASMREAVSSVRAKREKTLRKHNIVYRLNADSREDVPMQNLLVVGILYVIWEMKLYHL